MRFKNGMATDNNENAVFVAIIGNSAVMVAKFVAFFFTGSAAMLAEGIHSIADVSNQSLTLFGIKRSKRKADGKYKRGYGRERFVWALISAVGIFFLGFGVTFGHGMESLLGEGHAVDLHGPAFGWSIAVLIASFVIEGFVLWNAFSTLRASAGDKDFMKYVKEDADPSVVAVVLEDSAACIGVLIALVAILLAKVTGEHYWDALGSISISLLLGLIAVWLIVRNRELLLGQPMPEDKMGQLKSVIAGIPMIESVNSIHSEVLGAEVYDVQLELDLSEDEILDRLEVDFEQAYADISSADDLKSFCREYGKKALFGINDAVDDIEDIITKEIPEILYVDVEPDRARNQ